MALFEFQCRDIAVPLKTQPRAAKASSSSFLDASAS